jgi:hypothetical protein
MDETFLFSSAALIESLLTRTGGTQVMVLMLGGGHTPSSDL